SDGPPAGNGTTNLMGRFGNSWAASAPGQARTPSRQRTRMRVGMRHAPWGGAGSATWLAPKGGKAIHSHRSDATMQFCENMLWQNERTREAGAFLQPPTARRCARA